MVGEGHNKPSPLAEGLLTVDGCWETESVSPRDVASNIQAAIIGLSEFLIKDLKYGQGHTGVSRRSWRSGRYI